MQNGRLFEAQAGIKIAGININNHTTFMAESEEELKILLMKLKEESEKFVLKLNIQKMKIMVSGPITSWQIDGKTMETVTDFIFLYSKAKFSHYSRNLLTSCFCIPVPYDEKDIFFEC